MRQFTAIGTNTRFTCLNCGLNVLPLHNGSYRNHCPRCLYSLHIDNLPGDRSNNCLGLLKPVSVEFNGKKGWIIISKCINCGEIRRNKAAIDDPVMPDDYQIIINLSSQQR